MIHLDLAVRTVWRQTALVARGGRARKGWWSARRFGGLSGRCLSGLTRAGRHCGVVM